MRTLIAAVCALGIGGPVVLSDAAATPGRTVKERKTKRNKKKKPERKIFNFKGDKILGKLLRPDDFPITGDIGRRHKSLIEYRFDFVPEMIKDTDQL